MWKCAERNSSSLPLVCGRTSNKKSSDNSERGGWNSSKIIFCVLLCRSVRIKYISRIYLCQCWNACVH